MLGIGNEFQISEAGAFYEFQVPHDFRLTADKPFMLTQYMSGCRSVSGPEGCGQSGSGVPSGDPYMAQVVPVEQWLTVAPFLTDTSYPRDFVVVTRQVGTEVELACLGRLEDDRFERIEGTPFEVARIDLDIVAGEGACRDGAQFITSDQPVGIMVGGVDTAASYGYPGGMGLRPLWVPPQTPPEG